MNQLVWKPEFECGVASIDHEHEEMFDVINALLGSLAEDCTAEKLDYHLGEIHALIESHFALEEKLMRDRNYANYAPHKADHDRLLDDIRDIMDDNSIDTAMARDALAVRLQSWFSDHFSTMDTDLPQLAK